MPIMVAASLTVVALLPFCQYYRGWKQGRQYGGAMRNLWQYSIDLQQYFLWKQRWCFLITMPAFPHSIP
jgi:hypothetical protein